MKTLPRNLQRMISDARWTVENREPTSECPTSECIEQDEATKAILRGVDEWLENLSRGEFDQELYWTCQAEDCEEDGDWQGALAAYRQILALESRHYVAYSKAHRGLACIFNLLGQEDDALRHCHMAAHVPADESLDTIQKNAVCDEAWQYLRSKQVAKANLLLSRLLAQVADPDEDGFAYAHLFIVSSACHVMIGQGRCARKLLSQSWCALDSLSDSLTSSGIADGSVDPPGVMSLRGTWWLVEAERCRQIGKPKAELGACRESLRIAKHLAADDPVSIVGAEYTVMRRLLSLAEACQRQGLTDESAAQFNEAEAIAERRKFPEAAKRSFSLQPVSRPSVWQRILNRF